MRIIIIEDETAAFENIQRIIKTVEPDVEIEKHFDTVVDSVEWFRANPMPDLIFMDIHLADGSAFNIFECITIDVPVIFTTAYDQYAIKAFEVNSVDYLLKPITNENMQKALDKFHRLNPETLQQNMRQINRIVDGENYCQRILIPYRDKIIPIKTEAIAYFYNTNKETRVVTMTGESFIISKSLDSLQERLNPINFFRANRQFILSKEVIESITVWFDNRLRANVCVETEEDIFISKKKAVEFKEWISI